MVLRLKIGTVQSQGSFAQDGSFRAIFKQADGDRGVAETVRYVTPYGTNKSAFIAIPPAGSQVLCLYDDEPAKEGGMIRGKYYLGSIMGNIPGLNRGVPPPDQDLPLAQGGAGSETVSYTPKDQLGVNTPPSYPLGEAPMTLKKDQGPWPERFKDMYDGKGIMPEKVGFTTMRGDAMYIANRYRANKAEAPFQDHKVSLHSGSGKRIELIDSPIIDGIVMTNEHRGKDYLIWSTGMSVHSPFSAGEYHLRTHGPVNLYTLLNRFHIWVEDGLNIELENKSSAKSSYGGGINCDGRTTTDGVATGLGPPGTGGYKATRKGVFGNETTGCIQLWTHHNNISLSALEQDSVIHISTLGADSKVIIDSAGSVDIVAVGKITLQSNTEVEINAPIVDINATDPSQSSPNRTGTVYIDGGPDIHLNQPEDPPAL